MALSNYLPMTGNAYGMADGHVYLKQASTFDPYAWGGRCMRIDEQTIALRKGTATMRQATGGGVERHQMRYEPPGESAFSLIMKRTQASQIKTLLMSCDWHVDHRIHCDGAGRDNPHGWEEITRFCFSGADERRMSGSGWEDTTGDQMITIPMTALDGVDIYRVTGEGGSAMMTVEFADLTFVNGNPDTITSAAGDFTDFFAAADVFYVLGTANPATNYGPHVIAGGGVAANTLTLVSVTTVTNEGPSALVMSVPILAQILDIDVCHPARCPTGCDPQQDCKLAAVSSILSGPAGAPTPYLFTNLAGGDLDQWVSTSLTEWTTGNADFVLCMSDFLIVGSLAEFAILRSDDFGVTRQPIVQTSDPTPVVWGAANMPRQIDGIDQYYILMCGDSGYMYRSTDAGRTWYTVSAATATVQDLDRVMIARDNPQVAYAIGASNAFIKTENGGRTWLDVGGPSAGDALLGLWVKNAHHVLVLNDDGELWETVDGAESWTMQIDPDGMPATLTYGDIVGCGCDEYYMVATDGTELLIYRNVYGGASGFWYTRGTEHWEVLADDPTCIACCGPNRAVAAGGVAAAGWFYLLTA